MTTDPQPTLTGDAAADAATYLARLQAEAGQRLPADQADDLVSDIAEHLSEAQRVAGPAGVRTALDRLGSPRDIVDAAGGVEVASVGRGAAAAGSTATEHPHAGQAQPGWPPVQPAPGSRVEVAAVVCLVLSVLTALVWPLALLLLVAGVVLLLVSRRFTGLDKVLGGIAFVVLGAPAVLAAEFLAVGETCSSSSTTSTDGAASSSITTCTNSHAGTATLVGLAVALAFDVYVVIRLVRRIRGGRAAAR